MPKFSNAFELQKYKNSWLFVKDCSDKEIQGKTVETMSMFFGQKNFKGLRYAAVTILLKKLNLVWPLTREPCRGKTPTDKHNCELWQEQPKCCATGDPQHTNLMYTCTVLHVSDWPTDIFRAGASLFSALVCGVEDWEGGTLKCTYATRKAWNRTTRSKYRGTRRSPRSSHDPRAKASGRAE